MNYRSSYLDYLGDEGEELFNDDFGYGFIRFTDDYSSIDFTANTRLTSNFPYVLKQKTLEINLSFIIGIHLIDYLNTMNMVHPIHWDLGSIIDLLNAGYFNFS